MSIYFLQTGDDGPVKIGFATSVKARVKTIQLSSPEKLRVIREIEGDIPMERWLHRHFKKHQLNGEWFSFCDEMLVIEPPVIVKSLRKPREEKFSRGLSAALGKRAELFGGVAEFTKALAISLGMSQASISNWMYGNVLPGGAAWISLLVRFGPLFEIEVLGEESEKFDRKTELEKTGQFAADLRSLADEIDPSRVGLADLRVIADEIECSDTRVVPIAGKIS